MVKVRQILVYKSTEGPWWVIVPDQWVPLAGPYSSRAKATYVATLLKETLEREPFGEFKP